MTSDKARCFQHSGTTIVFALLVACADGGGGGGGCGGCGATGDGPAYEYPDTAPVIPQAAQVHVTETALTFIEDNLASIAGDLAGGGGGLVFCVPETDLTVATLCGGSSRCSDGSVGCDVEIVLNDVQATPFSETPSDRLNVAVGVSLGTPLALNVLFSTCALTLSEPVPVSANVYFDVTPPLDGRTSIRIPTDELEFDSDAAIDSLSISGGFGCTITSGLLNLVGGLLGGLIEGFLTEPLNGAIEPLLCQTCADAPCPFGSSCNDSDICIQSGTEECVPIDLGLETEFDIGELLASISPGLQAKLGLLFYLANYADANGPTVTPSYGLDLAAEAGFAAAEPSACVPYQPVPATSRIPKSTQLNTATTPGGEAFAVGIGLSESALELALYGVYSSGALCLSVGSETSELISTGTFSAFLPSLGALVDGANAPLSLTLRPQLAPTVTLGAGTVTIGGDGEATIDEPLLTLELRSLEIDFYTIVENRYVRVFTLDTDVEVPLGLTVNSANELVVLLGDLSEAITRIEALNGELLAQEEVENIAAVLPSIIGGLLPTLLGSGGLIPPIALPDLQGFRLVLPDDAFTSIESNTMLAIFANLEYVGSTPEGLTATLQPVIASSQVRYDDRLALNEMLSAARFDRAPIDINVLTPDVVLAMETRTYGLDSPGVEYSYRVNGGLWSFWRAGDELVIRDPVFALQGHHAVEVRAREIGDPYSTSVVNAATSIVVDYEAPSLTLRREGQGVWMDVTDTVALPSEMTARYRVNGGEWVDGADVFETIDISGVEGRVVVEAEVMDPAGNTTRRRQEFRNVEQAVVADVTSPTTTGALIDPVSNDSTPAPSAGCSAAGSTASSHGSALLFGMAVAGVWAARRRRAVALMVGGVAAVSLAACGDDRSGADVNDGTVEPAPCDPECGAGQTCEDGVCVGCATAEDCEPGFICEGSVCIVDEGCTGDQDCPDGQRCQDAVCVEVECQEDGDCTACTAPNIGRCLNNSCSCEEPCAEGCGEGEACCFGSNSCVPVSATCDEKVCEPGTSLQAVGEPEFDSNTCSAIIECECVELPPLPPGAIGRYLDAASDGETNHFVAYNPTYGDLMYGTSGADDVISWEYLLGVPSTGTVTGSVNGPRGGRSLGGPDVGLYPSVEVGGDGSVLLAFQTAEDDDGTTGLTFGVGAGAEPTWTFFNLDASPGAGLWSTMIKDLAGFPMVVYTVPGIFSAEAGTYTTEVRLVRATTASPTSAADFATPIVVDSIVSTAPCGGTCVGRDVCRLDTDVCERPTRASACDPACSDTQECFEDEAGVRACAEVAASTALRFFPTGGGLFLDAEVDSDGRLWVAHYDGDNGNLLLSSLLLGTEERSSQIIDGQTVDGAGVVTDSGNVGLHPDLMFTAAGELVIAYHDATLHWLRTWTRSSNLIEIVDDGYRCFNFDTTVNACREVITSRVGGDPVLFEGAGLEVLFQDATFHDLVTVPRTESGWQSFTTQAGNEAPYAGAFGFYSNVVSDSRGRFFATYRFQNRSEPTLRDVVIVRP
jgi:hypothetical protein